MKNIIASFVLVLSAMPSGAQHHGAGHAHAEPSPYAGAASRDIKALSPQEQQAWLEGQGQGLALAAELNGYPGPMHVLELAKQLDLAPGQVAASRALMERHKAEVRALGAQLVDAERELDLAFREKRIAKSDVERLTAQIGQLHARVRAAHLNTHLAQSALLSWQQVAAYNRLRGYSR